MNKGGRIFIVEALRGLAALSVAWFHLTNTYAPGWLSKSGAYGWLGVDVFFVISGFVIPYSIAGAYPHYGAKDFPRFVLRRLLRLEPPYIVSIVLVIVLGYLSALAPGFRGQPVAVEVPQLAAHLFYLVPLTPYSWLQPVYWTLAYEFVFYLTIGVLYPVIGAVGGSKGWWVLAAGAVIGTMYGVLPPICLLFLGGVEVFRLVRAAKLSMALVAEAVTLSAAIVVAMGVRGQVLSALVGMVTAATLVIARDLSEGQLTGPVLKRLGMLSYSLYLTHVPIGGRVVNLGRRFVSGAWNELALSLFALAICLAFAWLFHVAIERNAIGFARRITAKPRPLNVAGSRAYP